MIPAHFGCLLQVMSIPYIQWAWKNSSQLLSISNQINYKNFFNKNFKLLLLFDCQLSLSSLQFHWIVYNLLSLICSCIRWISLFDNYCCLNVRFLQDLGLLLEVYLRGITLMSILIFIDTWFIRNNHKFKLHWIKIKHK